MEFDDDDCASCPECDGSGEVRNPAWQRGYSCCRSAAALIEYGRRHGGFNATDPVVVFEGEDVGVGIDGEPLVVPVEGTERWTTFGEVETPAPAGE